MLEHAIKQLEYIVDTVPSILSKISEADLSFKPSPDKWSKKEIIGHLIDSATNNHQRFVRCQFEESPEIAYDQNKWCEFSFHQQMDGSQLIAFWALYNRRLIEIIKRIPENKLSNRVKISDQLLTLEFVIVDYVRHLNHHIEQLID